MSVQAAEIQSFLAAVGDEARSGGVSDALVTRAFKDFKIDDEIAALNANQPEFSRTAGEYVSLLVSETRIANGKARLVEHAALLTDIERRYGVDRHVVLAIWGVESSFGTSMGDRNVIRSLATLSLTDRRRAAFWRTELLAALKIVGRGDIAPEAMTGSWAGAMGHTQFMPSTFLAHAVDFAGDGRRDIWGAPTDALASAANYLKVSGWATGQPPAVEVRLPTAFDHALAAPDVAKPWADWLALGIAPIDPARVPGGPLNLILPAGHAGPAFLTGANFRAILRYNRAVPYALAVSHLADRFTGASPFATPWPSDDRSLSKVEREELQSLLASLGHDTGGVDGIIGTATRSAIRAVQRTERLPVDGHPNHAFLVRLRTLAGTPR